MQNEITLIISPSCSGKSTYIEQINSNSKPVLLGNELKANELPKDSFIVHYNSLILLHKNKKKMDDSLFIKDQALKTILNSNRKVTVYVLVCSKNNLIKRAILRDHTEPKLKKDNNYRYPNSIFLDVFNKLDIKTHYINLFKILKEYNIETKYIDSNEQFEQVPANNKSLKKSLGFKHQKYSLEEIQFITQKYQFNYHSIQLPYNIKTKGSARDYKTFAQINFESKTVLDVGSGYGAFCFYAESRGASSVLGTELKKDRHLGSIIIKNILDSNAIFSSSNILNGNIGETYDIVSLLNVIHHLDSPFHALKQLAKAAKETLIIEFPLPSDPKFRKTIPGNTIIDEQVPFVGVSTKAHDQTFVFNQLAIKRYMEEHVTGFKLEFHPSNISNTREIMIAHRISSL